LPLFSIDDDRADEKNFRGKKDNGKDIIDDGISL